MMKIYWVSRHDMSPAQVEAMKDLHGSDVEVVKDPAVFTAPAGLAEYIREHADGFVYAVAGTAHYLTAALRGCKFGVFENHPARRADGSFGLAAVYQVVSEVLYTSKEAYNPMLPLYETVFAGELKKVWENPDPMSDKGEPLVPIAR